MVVSVQSATATVQKNALLTLIKQTTETGGVVMSMIKLLATALVLTALSVASFSGNSAYISNCMAQECPNGVCPSQ